MPPNWADLNLTLTRLARFLNDKMSNFIHTYMHAYIKSKRDEIMGRATNPRHEMTITREIVTGRFFLKAWIGEDRGGKRGSRASSLSPRSWMITVDRIVTGQWLVRRRGEKRFIVPQPRATGEERPVIVPLDITTERNFLPNHHPSTRVSFFPWTGEWGGLLDTNFPY